MLYDIDENGLLSFEELKHYIQELAFKHINFSDKQLQDMFESIDLNGNGEIDRHEMALFLNLLLV